MHKFALLPTNPTPEMIEAGNNVGDLYRMGRPELWGQVYRAMIAVAPAAPEPSQAQGAPDLDLDKLEALARAADQGEGQHIYIHWRDSNNHAANLAWHNAASPASFLALIELARRATATNAAPADLSTQALLFALDLAEHENDDAAVSFLKAWNSEDESYLRTNWPDFKPTPAGEWSEYQMRTIKAYLAAQPAAVPGGAVQAEQSTVLEEAAKLILADLVPGKTEKLEIQWITHNAAVMRAAEVVRAFGARVADHMRGNALEQVISIISDDGYAMSFQSMGQYRSALLTAVRSLTTPPVAVGEAERQDQGVGFALHFTREQWGVIVDGVILEIDRSEKRKAANSESNSDERAELGRGIIKAINAASGAAPTDVAQVAKAEQQDQASVMPPFAAPAGQHDARLTDDDITRVWQGMPGGAAGWLKLFGYLQFARAVESVVVRRCRAQGGNTQAESSSDVAKVAKAEQPDQVLLDMLAIQEACGLHTDEYAPGSVIEYIKELEADQGAQVAPQPVGALVAKGDYVLMPRKLTAENGAKAALLGEFHEYVPGKCYECDGSGDDEGGDECPTCKGEGEVNQRVTVGWDTIKDIYARAVEELATPTTQQGSDRG